MFEKLVPGAGGVNRPPGAFAAGTPTPYLASRARRIHRFHTSMSALYLFALVLGGGFLLISVLGGESDAEVELDIDAGEVGGAEGAEAARLLSFRTVVYALFAFGATGVVLDRLGVGGASALAASVVCGAIAGVGVGGLFRWLARTESGTAPGDASLAGLVGKVTLPLSSSVPGTVVVTRGGRRIALRALPHGPEPEAPPEEWTAVLIVEVTDGVARVTPVDDAFLSDGSLDPPAPPDVVSGGPPPTDD